MLTFYKKNGTMILLKITLINQRLGGGIGRRTGLKILSYPIACRFDSGPRHHFMVAVVQLVERQFVALVVAGSNPVGHPIKILKCGSSSVGRASAFQAECREFDPRLPLHTKASLAQMVEHTTFNRVVTGSSPV